MLLDILLNNRIIRFTVGFALTLTASVLYLFVLKEEQDEYLHELESRKNLEKPIYKKVTICKEDFGRILGKEGKVINQIRDASNAKIMFSDYEDRHVAVIQGSSENVEDAEEMIQKILKEKHHMEIEEMYVEQSVCGRIIGKNGDTIRHINGVSGAKVHLEKYHTSKDSNVLRKITIKGTGDQIAMAKCLIEEKVNEEATHQNKKNKPVPERRKPRLTRNDKREQKSALKKCAVDPEIPQENINTEINNSSIGSSAEQDDNKDM